MHQSDHRVAFGQVVLGPIFADFALRLWTLVSSLERPDDAALLFCARGGLRLRLIYDGFLRASGLASPVKVCDLMVSRLVAVRVALSRDCPSAFEQIGYEMGGSSLHDVAIALGGPDCVATGIGADQPYTRDGLVALMASDAGQTLRVNVEGQAALFRIHLASLLDGRRRGILCDTGLSGSTMQLLEDGIPELHWNCALFARSNYKKLPAPHYPRTVGLSVQADGYSPIDRRSAILRYWHLIESTLEPDLASVSSFAQAGDGVRSNLEVSQWQAQIDPRPGEIFAGVMAYIAALPRGRAASEVTADVDRAVARLRRAVIWPSRADVATMNIPNRSVDFGRLNGMTGLACEPGLRKALKGSLWREGAVTLTAPVLSGPVLAGIEVAYVARWVLGRLRRSSGS